MTMSVLRRLLIMADYVNARWDQDSERRNKRYPPPKKKKKKEVARISSVAKKNKKKDEGGHPPQGIARDERKGTLKESHGAKRGGECRTCFSSRRLQEVNERMFKRGSCSGIKGSCGRERLGEGVMRSKRKPAQHLRGRSASQYDVKKKTHTLTW